MAEEKHIVTIFHIHQITHNVKAFRFSKPDGFQFSPGQATEVCVNKPGWENERRPFTFTCLNTDDYLEFTIKLYTEHDGVTNQLDKLVAGDQLILHDVWGTIQYRGPGVFIAGGAGITPFIAILRQQAKDGNAKGNVLYFSNKTEDDIILRQELLQILGKDAHFILTDEKEPGLRFGRIDKNFLKTNIKDFSQPFYICGPDKMISDVREALKELGADPQSVVFEK